jgi:hypothetical protein
MLECSKHPNTLAPSNDVLVIRILVIRGVFRI